MPEPRQINPVYLNFGDADADPMDFTPRPVAVPKASYAPAFADSSHSGAPRPSDQSRPPSSSEGSITTLESSILNGPSPSSESAESMEGSASAEKAPTPTTPEKPSPQSVSVAVPPPAS